jgi:hypothetical protein
LRILDYQKRAHNPKSKIANRYTSMIRSFFFSSSASTWSV